MSYDWEKKDSWLKRASNFTIEVKKHTVATIDDGDGPYSSMSMGPHRWCVYVYIYPNHPFFKHCSTRKNWHSRAVDYLPLHGGCTFFRAHRANNGKITSFQVGCDYSHYGDEFYSQMKSKEDAGAVFADAEDLYRYMERGELK